MELKKRLNLWNAIPIVRIFVVLVLLSGFFFSSCAEDSKGNNYIKNLYNTPNPFSPSGDDDTLKETEIMLVYQNKNQTSHVKVDLTITGSSYDLIRNYSRDYDLTYTLTEQTLSLVWDGRNDNGKPVFPGIYTATVRIESTERTNAEGQLEIGGDVDTEQCIMIVH